MELFNLNKLKRPQLIELAGKVDIKGRHRLRKRELVKLLRKHLPVLKDELDRLRQPAQTSTGASTEVPSGPTPDFSGPYTETFSDRGAPIPVHYGRDRLVMMVRDPHWVFCYWELEGQACEDLKRRHGRDIFDQARWTLRLQRTGASHPDDIDIQPEAGNWYINVHDDTEYSAELGIVARTGEFLALVGSNRVRTPRAGMSDQVGTEWMTVRGDFDSIRRHVSGEVTVQAGAGQLLTERFGVHGLDSLFFGASQRASRIPPK